MASPYKIHLDMYDGPLDLLLDLIKKQEIDIHNIPIAKITGQYLEYLHKLEQLDMDISADSIYMAATLILIKSKMLLPPDPLAGPEDQGDPRAELVYRLVEHEKFKNAAQLLYERQQLEAHVWSKPDLSLYEGPAMEGALLAVLELLRLQAVVLSQSELFGAILLRKHKMFDVFFSGGKIEYSEDGAQGISPAGEPDVSGERDLASARGESSPAPSATDDLDTP